MGAVHLIDGLLRVLMQLLRVLLKHFLMVLRREGWIVVVRISECVYMERHDELR